MLLSDRGRSQRTGSDTTTTTSLHSPFTETAVILPNCQLHGFSTHHIAPIILTTTNNCEKPDLSVFYIWRAVVPGSSHNTAHSAQAGRLATGKGNPHQPPSILQLLYHSQVRYHGAKGSYCGEIKASCDVVSCKQNPIFRIDDKLATHINEADAPTKKNQALPRESVRETALHKYK
jgi:hypothetical protein